MTARRLCHGPVGHVSMTLGTWLPSGKCPGRPVQAAARYAEQAREQTMLVDLAELAVLVEGERLVRRVQHGGIGAVVDPMPGSTSIPAGPICASASRSRTSAQVAELSAWNERIVI
jgi:hypothetical protein